MEKYYKEKRPFTPEEEPWPKDDLSFLWKETKEEKRERKRDERRGRRLIRKMK